jgi:hypothetical protein
METPTDFSKYIKEDKVKLFFYFINERNSIFKKRFIENKEYP